jgi:hypothetical protein
MEISNMLRLPFRGPAPRAKKTEKGPPDRAVTARDDGLAGAETEEDGHQKAYAVARGM